MNPFTTTQTDKPKIPSLKELKRLRKPIRNINAEQEESLTRLQKFSVWITDHVGTMGFFLIILLWSALWLTWNAIAPHELRFDPYPAFVLWLFISNMIQILLMPLIMIGQNLQGRHSEARAQSDYEVNIKAEREIEAILEHLENQHDLLAKIVTYLENERK
jgi:uncharacterized membrane protein